jgi:hypothetical protein
MYSFRGPFPASTGPWMFRPAFTGLWSYRRFEPSQPQQPSEPLCGDIVANPIPEEYVPAILPHPWRVVLPGCSSALKLILRMSVNGGGLRLASTVIDKG